MEIITKKADLWHLFYSVTSITVFISVTKKIWSNINSGMIVLAAVAGVLTGFVVFSIPDCRSESKYRYKEMKLTILLWAFILTK